MKINSILILFFLLWSPWYFYAQIVPVENDSIVMEYTLIDGDSIPVNAIDLHEVMLLHRLKFDNSLERRRYVILRRKTIKVYPYATLAAERLESLNERLNSLESKRDKRVYARRIQKFIENEFSDELKKLTRTEGQILVKLVHRQTGMTTFDLIKDLRNGWRAFWFNTTATLFNISLKEEFDPVNVKEDYYIEDILERSFQSGVLKRQEPAIQFDFYELSNKWLK